MIRIHILGTAAGGGLPQWNCACANCTAARTGKITPQTQSSIAISGDSEGFHRWFLINASPDLSRQIENMPRLQPRRDSPRNSPIAGVLLTNADIDHALGLLLLREQGAPLVVHAADETRAALAWIDGVLARFCGIEWRKVGPEFQTLSGNVGFRGIPLSKSVAFQFRDNGSGGTVLFAPNVGELTDELRDAVHESDIVLFDGTFWSDGELAAIRPGARTARQMNHLPIGDGSLQFLHQSPARRKIYTHINNTNPILMASSRERAHVKQSGIEIARDGLEIVI
ncbi:MAG TPA: MBL fold metallo-hydrolase [Candidatus Udaeobacter sp.]|nr:MBL fold metallo-hydrolase [Candidatus Udaeobacter sp.]